MCVLACVSWRVCFLAELGHQRPTIGAEFSWEIGPQHAHVDTNLQTITFRNHSAVRARQLEALLRFSNFCARLTQKKKAAFHDTPKERARNPKTGPLARTTSPIEMCAPRPHARHRNSPEPTVQRQDSRGPKAHGKIAHNCACSLALEHLVGAQGDLLAVHHMHADGGNHVLRRQIHHLES